MYKEKLFYTMESHTHTHTHTHTHFWCALECQKMASDVLNLEIQLALSYVMQALEPKLGLPRGEGLFIKLSASPMCPCDAEDEDAQLLLCSVTQRS